MWSKRRTHPVTLALFDDVLAVDGIPAFALPYRLRRQLLESLELDGPNGARYPDVEHWAKATGRL